MDEDSGLGSIPWEWGAEGGRGQNRSKERFVFIVTFLPMCRCHWCCPLHHGLIYDSYPAGHKMFRADDLPVNISIKGLKLIMALVVITLPLT